MSLAVPPPSTTPATPARTTENDTISTDISTLSSDTASDLVKTATLRYRIDQVVRQNEARGITTGVDITDLRSGQTLVDHNIDGVQFAASINKLPIALLVLQDLRAGKIHMNDVLTWQPSDVRAGFGMYDQPGAPLTATVHDIIQDMLNRSGNTAVRILVNNTSLGGAAAVNARLAQYPQLVQTRLQPLDGNRFFLGNSTAGESRWIMEQVQKTKDADEQFMQHAMETNIFVSFGVRSQLQGNNYISLANKVGILDDPDGNNRHDTGIIYNARTHRSFSYSFMTTNFTTDAAVSMQAEASLQQMGRDLLRFAGDKPSNTISPRADSQAPAPQAQQLPPQKKVLY